MPLFIMFENVSSDSGVVLEKVKFGVLRSKIVVDYTKEGSSSSVNLTVGYAESKQYR